MLRLELTFLHLATGGGCFRWWDKDSTYLQSEQDSPRRFFDSLYFACNPLIDNARILVQFVKTPNVLNILR
jgi:hypothetical protein